MGVVKTKKHKYEKEIFKICKTCLKGTCCKDGVDVDLEQAKKISKLRLKLKRPWFRDLFRDSDMPSGWALSTAVKKGSCIFQAKDYRCRIYNYRPKYCRDFPIEHGGMAEFYHYLCEKPHHIKRKVKKYLKRA